MCDKIAQLIFERIKTPELKEMNDLEETRRGSRRRRRRFPTLVVRKQGACHRHGLSAYMYDTAWMSGGHV